MIKQVFIWLLLLSLAFTGTSQTVLFSEDFGSSTTGWYQSSSPNWDCRHSSANDWSVGTAPCASQYERAYALSGFGYYITTKQITLGASGNQVSFDYSFDYFSFSSPEVRVLTGTCGSSGTDITSGTLVSATCDNVSFSLDAYANQTIRLVFYSNTSSEYFYFDNVIVSTGNGGGGGGTSTDVKWADTFADGDTDLDFTGNDGDEDCSGAVWSLVDGASIANSGSYTVNRNETEAFNTTSDDNSGYAVLLDKNESLESPTVDLSTQESFKISYYAMKQGGSANWNSWTKLYLEYWDGSAWQTLQTIKNSATATSSENDYFIESGFGYHCFTVYKSNTSPGNYYYSSAPHVNSNCFHSDFKLRWRLYESSSFDDPQLYIDNITFRAGDDGESCIPCGLSFWNGPNATHYGKDPEATPTNHAPRGVEVETDELFSGMKGTPDWTGHFNDGNTGGNDLYEIMWAVVSEQKISTTDAKVNFTYPDGTSPQNKTMYLDDTYTGPGYLYYYKEFADCDGSSAGSFNTGPGIIYHFYFEYGSDFRPVYTHLNASGIEMGGGVTDLSEGMNPAICNTTLPVELLNFDVECQNNHIQFNWSTANEKNADYFLIYEIDENQNTHQIAQINAVGNTCLQSDYQYIHEARNQDLSYYQLIQVDINGESHAYDIAAAHCDDFEEFHIELYPNPIINNEIILHSDQNIPNINIELLTLQGQCIDLWPINLIQGINRIEPSKQLKEGTYLISIRGDQLCKNLKLMVR